MRKKKFFKKHKIAIILGLLATANLSVIGFATFVFPATDPTISTLPDVDINVGETGSRTEAVTFSIGEVTSFSIHPDGFLSNGVLSNSATLSVVINYSNCTLVSNINFSVSLSNTLETDFFSLLSAIKFKIGETEIKTYTYSNKTITYSSGITAEKLGIIGKTSGSITFTFTFTVATPEKSFYEDYFLGHLYDKDLKNLKNLSFALSIAKI